MRRGHTRVGTRPDGRARSAPAAPVNEVTKQLTDDERALLGDLLAVIEEHSDAGRRARWTAMPSSGPSPSPASATPTSAAAPGEDFITHPVEVAKICAGLRLDTETLCAALLHDTVEDTSASLDEVTELFGDSVARPRRRRHEADRDHLPEPRRAPGRELPQDDGRDGHGRPGHPDQARRPPPQHAHALGRCRSRSSSTRPARRSRSTRRWRTASGSTRSSGSWRTSPSSACTRASTTRSRSSSPSSATERETLRRRGRRASCAAS